ncbi:hypothetical protein T484DRAFT_1820066, partial [Baffinella frigidus]
MKKEFAKAGQLWSTQRERLEKLDELLWSTQRERLEKLDELGMATMRIQLLLPGEELAEGEEIYRLPAEEIPMREHQLLCDRGEAQGKVDLGELVEEIPMREHQLLCDRGEAQERMREALGQFNYLSNLAKVQEAIRKRKRREVLEAGGGGSG